MRLLTIEDVADRLAVAPISVRRLVRAGRLTPVRPLGARAVRFAEDDLELYIRGLRGGDDAAGGAA